eukprot:2737802-Karenia_brevis.AAC.1
MRPPPPGYAKVSLEQLQRADKEVFRRVVEITRAGVTIQPDGKLPCEEAIKQVIHEASVQVLLMHLPATSGPASSEKRPGEPEPTNQPMSNRQRKKMRMMDMAGQPGGKGQSKQWMPSKGGK